jgi:zinc transporter, ZIP family
MEELHGSFGSALLITLFAGLATGIGAFVSVFVKKKDYSFLSLGLGFSAGVMIYVSFMELLVHSGEALEASFGHGTKTGLIRIAAFFGGILLAGAIDRLIPESANPHECGHDTSERIVEECNCEHKEHDHASEMAKMKLARMGVFAAVAIAIHNFPEGFAVFAAALKEPALGLSVGVAIAIHNIPEGMAIAIPVYYATGSRIRAFTYAFLSGFAEPLGAIIGYLLLKDLLAGPAFGIVFGVVAGIMIYISFDELLPAARRYGKGHLAITGLVLGMLVMSLGLDVLGHSH